MKTSWISIFLFLAICTACKKEEQQQGLTGTWELRDAGGSVPNKSFASGNGSILKLTDTEYQIFEAGKLQKSGSYQVVPDPSFEASVCLVKNSGEYDNRIVFDTENNPKVFLQLIENKLSLYSGCFAVDGGTYKIYERIYKTY